jgi:hypothetical protein
MEQILPDCPEHWEKIAQKYCPLFLAILNRASQPKIAITLRYCAKKAALIGNIRDSICLINAALTFIPTTSMQYGLALVDLNHYRYELMERPGFNSSVLS